MKTELIQVRFEGCTGKQHVLSQTHQGLPFLNFEMVPDSEILLHPGSINSKFKVHVYGEDAQMLSLHVKEGNRFIAVVRLLVGRAHSSARVYVLHAVLVDMLMLDGS